MSEDVAATIAARTACADTILLGRATYELFATEWPYRSGPTADFVNTTRKVVVSTSLDEVSWQNTALIDGNALIGEELARLRHEPGKDIVVLGSATLVESLRRRAMIDELVLLVQPVIKGRGRRLFEGLNEHAPMQEVECVTFDSGLVSLSYEMNSRPASGHKHQRPRTQMPAPEDTTMHTTPDPSTRELDHRSGDGIDVTLLWNSLTDRVSVEVEDERAGEYFELDVDPEDALIAFEHPYAYASLGRGWTDQALAA